MSLLRLPAELSNDIVESILYHPGFESFALACKDTYRLAETYLREYNTLRRRWRSTTINGPFDKANCPEGCLDILRVIATKPVIASFIETLNLEPQHNVRREARLSDAEKQTIMRLVSESRVLRLAGQDIQTWLTGMQLDESPLPKDTERRIDMNDDMPQAKAHIYRITFLLTILPNLRNLVLPDFWALIGRAEGPEGCNEVLDTIAKTRDDSEDFPLKMLTTFEYDQYLQGEPPFPSGVDIVAPFLPLPRLSRLTACNLIALDHPCTGLSFSWKYDSFAECLRFLDLSVRYMPIISNSLRTPASSPTLKLSLPLLPVGHFADFSGLLNQDCWFDARNISLMLSKTPQLETFRYSLFTKWCTHQFDWDGSSFVQAVGERCGNTLRNLSITIEDLFGDVQTGVVSMQQFKVLESFEADIEMFCAPSADSGIRLGFKGVNEDQWSENSVPALSAILPSSIKNFRLICQVGRNRQGLIRLCSLPDLSPIPFLQRICVYNGSEEITRSRDNLESPELLAEFSKDLRRLCKIGEDGDSCAPINVARRSRRALFD